MLIEHIQAFVERRIRRWHPVIEFFVEPCETPFSAYIRTAPGALTGPVLTLLSFGWGDVARGALRPKDINPRSHLRRKGGRMRSVGVPEVGNEIGKTIRDVTKIGGQSINLGERLLWVADGLVQRLNYFLLLEDVFGDAASNWISAIKKEQFCSLAGPGKFLSRFQSPVDPWPSMKDNPQSPPTQILYGGQQLVGSAGNWDMGQTNDYRIIYAWELRQSSSIAIAFEWPYHFSNPTRSYSRLIVVPPHSQKITVAFEMVQRCRRIDIPFPTGNPATIGVQAIPRFCSITRLVKV